MVIEGGSQTLVLQYKKKGVQNFHATEFTTDEENEISVQIYYFSNTVNQSHWFDWRMTFFVVATTDLILT